jgi:hypothetical protein
MHAISPTGSPIVGTADMVPANALIQQGSFTRGADGAIEFEWEGESLCCWDGQYTKQRDGKDLYVDENGEEWTEDQIKLVENE